MKKLIYFLFLALSPLSSHCQNGLQEKKNSLEIFFPVSHFFDGTSANWLLWEKHFVNPKYDTYGDLISNDSEYKLPATYGIQYLRGISPRSQLLLAVHWYGKGYNQGKLSQPGEVVERQYFLYSLGYLYNLLNRHRTRLAAMSKLSFRNGGELVHIAYPFWFEEVVDDFWLKDWGLSAGLRVDYDLPWGFLLSAEASYTHFLYVFDNKIDYLDVALGPSRNILTIKWGVGYRF